MENETFSVTIDGKEISVDRYKKLKDKKDLYVLKFGNNYYIELDESQFRELRQLMFEAQ